MDSGWKHIHSNPKTTAQPFSVDFTGNTKKRVRGQTDGFLIHHILIHIPMYNFGAL
jgi:hypothetical protein